MQVGILAAMRGGVGTWAGAGQRPSRVPAEPDCAAADLVPVRPGRESHSARERMAGDRG